MLISLRTAVLTVTSTLVLRVKNKEPLRKRINTVCDKDYDTVLAEHISDFVPYSIELNWIWALTIKNIPTDKAFALFAMGESMGLYALLSISENTFLSLELKSCSQP